MTRSHPHSSTANAPDLSATQARLGRDVFWVLVISLVLTVSAVTAAWIYRAPDLAASQAKSATPSAIAHNVNAPPSQPIQGAPTY
jgi:hypothetical protein